MDRLVITRLKGRLCAAFLQEGKLLGLEFGDEDAILGNIYIGRVDKVEKGLEAAFIQFSLGRMGYYSLRDNLAHQFVNGKKDAPLKAGDELIVQVARESVGTKDPVLTGRLSLAGRFCVAVAGEAGIAFSARFLDIQKKAQIKEMLSLQPGIGAIVRTNALYADARAVSDEYALLSEALKGIFLRAECRTCFSCIEKAPPFYIRCARDLPGKGACEVVTDEPACWDVLKKYFKKDEPPVIFYTDRLLSLAARYRLEHGLKKALSRKVWLDCGGYLVIDRVEAMTVIDVNSGKFAGNRRLGDTVMKINLEAADEILSQLRLRNLSGIILVDFIDMDTQEDKEQLMARLRAGALRDPVKTTVVDMTKLGLVEMTRKKIKRTLAAQLGGDGQSLG